MQRSTAASPPSPATGAGAHLVGPLIERARQARDQARWDECTAVAALGLREALCQEDPGRMPDFLNLLGAVAFQKGEMDAASLRFGEALRLVHRDPSRRAAALVNLGAVANVRGRFDEALVFYRRGRRSYREAGNAIGQARALHNMGMLFADRQQWRRSEWCYQTARELAASGQDSLLLGTLALNASEVYVRIGDLERARSSCDEACRRLTELGALPGIADAHRRYGEIYRRLGEFRAARRQLRIAVRLGRRVESPLPEAEALREQGALERDCGSYERALFCYGRAFRLFRSLEAGHELADSVLIDIVEVIGRKVERSDPRLFGHSSRVAQYAAAIAAEMELDDEAVKAVLVAGYLHDVGKLQIDPAIIAKDGPLTDEERARVSCHSALGAQYLARFDLPWDIVPIVRAHHEEYDGTGYPDALVGEEIPLVARILHVADVFDALITRRPWRPAWTRDDAIKFIAGRAGGGFDPVVVVAFLRMFGQPAFAGMGSRHEAEAEALRAMPIAEALNVIPLRSRRAA